MQFSILTLHHHVMEQTRLPTTKSSTGGAVAEWVRELAWTGDRTDDGSSPTAENFSLQNFGNSVYPALPVSFG